MLTIGYIILCQLWSTFSCIGTLLIQIYLLMPVSIVLTTCFFKCPKEICNLLRSIFNIITNLPQKDYGINTTFLLPDYIHHIRQHLIHALNDQGQLRTISQGVTKHSSAKFGRSHYLSKLQYHAYVRFPVTRTVFILQGKYETHINSNNHFP